MMVDVDDVITIYGLKPQDFRFDKNDEDKLEKIIKGWILQSEDLIKAYTNNNFDNGEVPEAVKNVCLRLTSNMITHVIQRRDSPIIKVNDWTVSTGDSAIFTEPLKNDLQPFIIDKSHKSDRVSFLAITGDTHHGKSHHKSRFW